MHSPLEVLDARNSALCDAIVFRDAVVKPHIGAYCRNLFCGQSSMPVARAMSIATLCLCIAVVFQARGDAQVHWIDAGRGIAGVHDYLFIGNVNAKEVLQGEAVRAARPIANKNDAIAVSVFAASPQPASLSLVYAPLKCLSAPMLDTKSAPLGRRAASAFSRNVCHV